MHKDPAAKSKRITDTSGNVVSTIELDPWGGETNRSSNEAFQPRKFTTYERDSIGSDEAMHRRYNRWWARFEQPDPYSGSYNLGDPQSFNRYSYVQNDPVNFVDPTGLDPQDPGEPPPPPMPPGPLDVITTDIWGSLPGGLSASGLLGGDSHAQLLLVNFLIFQGGAPQNSQGTAQQENRDCYAFADEVARIASDRLPNITVVERLMMRFATSGLEFGSDGFRNEFQDQTDSPNQARHYVGGFFAGYHGHYFGGRVGRAAANLRERDFVFLPTPGGILGLPVIPLPTQLPETASQRADKALNAVSTRHGADFYNKKLKASELADKIRNEVCAR